MYSGILTWLFYLFSPLVDLAVRPILPQERLWLGPTDDGPWQDIITGCYGVPPLLKIHDRKGAVKWSWGRQDVTQKLPPKIERCLYSPANDATEIKWMNNGTQIAAIYSALALVINYTPDNPETDKLITFAVCRDNEWLWNAHSIEPLPGDRIAVATTGQRAWDGILVYNSSIDNPLVEEPPILQNITGLRAIHGLIWDQEEQMLWAAGTEWAADGSDNVEAHDTVQAYPYDAVTGDLQKHDSLSFSVPHAWDQEAEWGKGYSWWCGPHDLVPVPNERMFLVSDDRDIHAFNVSSREWIEDSEVVAAQYLHGFEPVSNDRSGYNRKGEWEYQPRSNLKSFSLAPDGMYLYVQSLRRLYRGDHTNVVIDGVREDINIGDEIYRTRWFADIPGWPKP